MPQGETNRRDDWSRRAWRRCRGPAGAARRRRRLTSAWRAFQRLAGGARRPGAAGFGWSTTGTRAPDGKGRPPPATTRTPAPPLLPRAPPPLAPGCPPPWGPSGTTPRSSSRSPRRRTWTGTRPTWPANPRTPPSSWIKRRGRQETMKPLAPRTGRELRDSLPPKIPQNSGGVRRTSCRSNIFPCISGLAIWLCFCSVLVLLQSVLLVLVGTVLVQWRKRLWISGLVGWIWSNFSLVHLSSWSSPSSST